MIRRGRLRPSYDRLETDPEERPMALIETDPSDIDPNLGAQIVADAKEHVLYSWSVQNAINPIPVAGAEGRHFWDYDGNRYLDFASQLVNVNIGHQHPKIIQAIKDQADKLCTIGPPMANESRRSRPATSRSPSSRTAAPRRTRTRSSSRGW
jgi:4-aminobutyrate aminotransferase-like enzyme